MDVLSYTPGIIVSNLSKVKEESKLLVISSKEAARTMLDKLGHESVTTGSWKHCVLISIYSKLLDLLPYKARAKTMLDLSRDCKKEWDKLN